MKKVIRLLLILGFLFPAFVSAQEPSIKVLCKSQVVVGEQFQVGFEMNAEGKDFKAPSFTGFTLVGGPFSSSSSSIQMVNGSVTRSVKNTYTYVLRAENEGSFKIGSASFSVKGTTVSSDPYEVKVVADDGTNIEEEQPVNKNNNDPRVSGKDLFLRVEPSKKSVYLGEPLVLTYKIYTRVPVSSLSVSRMPSYAGFWMKDVSDDNGGALRQSTERMNGKDYTVAELQKVVIVPQKAGKLPIETMAVECVAQLQSQNNNRRSNDPFEAFFNDPFFNRNVINVKKLLETAAISIEVKPLPAAGQPSGFLGAVGGYNFSATIDKTNLKTNEAFALTLTVSGTGNIELLEMPTPVFPPDFEVYDPKITMDVKVGAQGLSGTKKAEFLVIPRHAGDFTIPAVEFSFFNPANNSYSTQRSDAYEVHVDKGAAGEGNEGAVFSSNQEDIKYLGSDIRHIVTGDAKLKPSKALFFASPLYFILLIVLLLLFFVALVTVKKRAKYKENVTLVRNRQATKVAKGRLKNAYNYLKTKDQDHFYVEMSQALWGYISDKLGIERSVLSIDTVREALAEKGVPEDLNTQFTDTLNSCEFARFAPGDASKTMDDLYQQGIDVITKSEKVLK